ncbi:MAG TPA: DUF3810 family protein, partial [Bacteroidales bacterium]|nr:DUF3810 family protein [Bacteroidales bacterium]
MLRYIIEEVVTKPRPYDRTAGMIKKLIKNSWPFATALLVYIMVRYSVHHRAFVETYYSEWFYPGIARVLSGFSRHIGISLWDLLWLVIVILFVCSLLLLIMKTIKPGWLIFRVIKVAAVLYSIFYITWGFNYFRPGIQTRLGWDKTVTDEAQFREVLDTLIMQANKCYTNINLSDYDTINRLVEESYRAQSRSLGLDYPNGYRRTKTMIFSSLLIKFGISGYFGPFFNEVNLDYYIQPRDFPFTLAHEKAHQFGIASEAEANLLAFITCYNSDSRKLRYSACRNLLLYFLGDASSLDDYKEILSKLDPRILHDLQMRQKYYTTLRNK